MFSLTFFSLIAIKAFIVSARDEELFYGWKPEPHGRGTRSILWSCLATIFICSWSALHLRVPKCHGQWYLYFRKFRYMALSILAPEVALCVAANNFFVAHTQARHFAPTDKSKWTLTQLQFANARGFWTRGDEPAEQRPYDIEQLLDLITDGRIGEPPLSDEELNSRGKSDLVIKLFFLLQITWFFVQTLSRAILHYQTTAFEVMTVAFVCCTIATISFSIKQPQNVEYPIFLEVEESKPANEQDGGKKLSQRTSLSQNRASLEAESQRRDRSTRFSKIRGRSSLIPVGPSINTALLALTGTALFQEAWYVIDIEKSAGTPATSNDSSTALPRQPRQNRHSPWYGLTNPKYVPGWVINNIPIILFGLSACGFGAVHCLAWNSPFPTVRERLAWQICAASTTALPVLLGLTAGLTAPLLHNANYRCVVLALRLLITSIYILGRLTLIVLAFMAFRVLPEDAYQTVEWNQYFPHFSG